MSRTSFSAGRAYDVIGIAAASPANLRLSGSHAGIDAEAFTAAQGLIPSGMAEPVGRPDEAQ